MNQFMKQFTAIWSKLGVNQKATILLILVAFAAGMAALVHVSSRPSYEMLYSDLDEKDMSEVVSYLKEAKTPYRVTDGGRSIMVAEGSKYDARLGLASKGVITGGHVGLELWDAPGWGASPTAEQMMKRRAMQGELARTIMHIEQIAWADVQIAQGEESLFAQDARPTTAAITLKMESGRRLTPIQIAGISRLVAGSVEGLSPDNVTMIDENGNLLTQARSDSTTTAAADAHNYQRAYEEYLASKGQAMLDGALGHNKSVVKISAELDMSQMSETREDFDPNNRVAKTEKFMSKSSSPEGASGGAGSQSEEQNETQYEVPRIVRTLESAPGTVKRLDVAVIVDPSYTDAEGNAATLTPEQLADLGTIVKRAVGLVEGGTRNDTFQLTAMPFNAGSTAVNPEAGQDTNKRQFLLQAVRYGSAIAAAIVFVIFAGLGLRRLSRASAAGAPAAGVPSLLQAEMISLGGGNGNGHLRNRVKELIAKDPATAARLLQRWVNEDDAKKGKRNG